jgi:hypothetical protein
MSASQCLARIRQKVTVAFPIEIADGFKKVHGPWHADVKNVRRELVEVQNKRNRTLVPLRPDRSGGCESPLDPS